MEPEPVLFDSHLHTPLCRHATGELDEYAEEARRRGLKGIVFTCHNPTDDGWSPGCRMPPQLFDTYVEMVTECAAVWRGRVEVRLGLESDYYPGCERWLGELHSRVPMDFVMGSVHAHLLDYREEFLHDGMLAFQRLYFVHLAEAAEAGLFDCIGHPDLVKNVAPEQWNPGVLTGDIERCLDRIAATGVAMELNTSGAYKAIREMNPSREILAQMQRRSIPVVIGSDAHTPDRVAEGFEAGLDILQDVGYSQVSVYVDRSRCDIDIREAKASLREVE